MRNLFVISSEDVQLIAQNQIDRKLNIKELEKVRDKLDSEFDSWAGVVETAIDEL